MENYRNLYDNIKIKQIEQHISEIISNLKSNSSSFKHFIQNLSNKHQQFMFGYFFLDGNGIERSEEEYLRLMKLSADQGHVLAEERMGFRSKYGIGIEKNIQLSFEYYLRAATKGYSVAQYEVAECYEKGRGVEKDLCLAFEWFKKSAENGNSPCFKVGWCYFYGVGSEVNEEEAIKWLQLAADKGTPEGMAMMGLFYHFGRVVEKDRNKSIQIFEKAALQGFSDAKYYLGLHYLQEERDPSNQTKGFQIFRNIDSRDVRAMNCVGVCYEFGLGTEKNENKAFQFYSRTSDPNYKFPPGTYNVGRCLEEGIGVRVNLVEARKCFRKTSSINGKKYHRGGIDAKNKLRVFEEDKVNFKLTFRNKRRFWRN